MLEPVTVLLLTAASLLAGFIDAIAGGGGLVLLPALLVGLPITSPLPMVLGTNKLAACSGTSLALSQFVRARIVPLRTLVVPTLLAMLGSLVGARLTGALSALYLRPVMLVLLIAMLLFVLLQPRLGEHHAPKHTGRASFARVAAITLAVGFYDGFFGPGTGTLLIFLFVTLLGFDFLHASAFAKAANWGSNIAALTWFTVHGHVLWGLAVLLAAANVAGAFFGSRLALKRGNRLVRWVFVSVTTGLLVKLGWQAIQTLWGT